MKTKLCYLTPSRPITTALAVATLLISVLFLFFPILVRAEPNNPEWSWTSNSPKVYSSSVVSEADPTSCQGVYQSKDIKGENGSQITCLMAGDNVKFGTYYPGNNISSAVSFAFDTKMHQVWGACNNYNSCLYLPGTDTLATKQYLLGPYIPSLVVYKHFTSRLKTATHGMTKGYDFDTSNPDYIFRDADGLAWSIGGYGASDNGKWLAMEFRQRGIGLLDIETLEMKRVSNLSLSYGAGFDPTSELAVSNDGKSLSIMGLNSGFSIFDNNPNCGDEAANVRLSVIQAFVNTCKTANINVSEIFDDFKRAFNPRFDAGGGELSFYAASFSNKLREVSMRASGYGDQRLDYLALGDSFTSGEGETDDKYYVPGTNDKFEKCHLSTRSYPYLVASLQKINSNFVRSVACSGATTEDVIGNDTIYAGQGNRLGDTKLKLSKPDQALAKTQAKYSYLPGRVHQEFFAKDNNSKVITIGIGGNDAGLMDKMTACAGLTDTCNWANDPKKKEQTAVEIRNIFDKLVNTYKKIHEDSPGSKIYVIGYPNIIDPDGNCDHITNQSLDRTERDFAAESVKYLNQIVEAAAKSAGVKFIDVQYSYGNQTLCGSKSPNAISGIRTGDDTNLVNDSEWFRFIGNESFHPNSIGHSLVADSIQKSVDNLLNDSYCVDNSNMCPNDSIKAPEPSSYWIPENYHDYPTQQIANYVFDSNDSTDNRQKDLVLDSSSLSPNSAISVEVTSNPISLGNFVASSDGSLNTSVTLPVGLAEGYHTVHLYGTSYSGESIELYQVIEFVKPVIKSSKPTPNQSISSAETQDRKDQSMEENVNLADKTVDITEDSSKPEVKGDSIVVAVNKQAKISSNVPLNDNTKFFPVYVFVLLVMFVTLIIATVVKHKKRR